MSIKRDVNNILMLIPTAREPTSEELAAMRKRLCRNSARQLRTTRRYLEELHNTPKDPRWERAQARVRSMSDITPLLQRWEGFNQWAGERLKGLRAT